MCLRNGLVEMKKPLGSLVMSWGGFNRTNKKQDSIMTQQAFEQKQLLLLVLNAQVDLNIKQRNLLALEIQTLSKELEAFQNKTFTVQS